MSKALSLDLRERVVAAVLDGATHREAAVRFGVSAASVSESSMEGGVAVLKKVL